MSRNVHDHAGLAAGRSMKYGVSPGRLMSCRGEAQFIGAEFISVDAGFWSLRGSRTSNSPSTKHQRSIRRSWIDQFRD
jgi:hypothetical protein